MFYGDEEVNIKVSEEEYEWKKIMFSKNITKWKEKNILSEEWKVDWNWRKK